VLRWRPALVGTGAAAALLVATWCSDGADRRAATRETVRVALIQPSIEQPLKWEPRHTRETLASTSRCCSVSPSSIPTDRLAGDGGADDLRRDPR